MESVRLTVECFYSFRDLFQSAEFDKQNSAALFVPAFFRDFLPLFGVFSRSNCCAAGLFECVRKLQHAALAEMRPKDLQAHGKAGRGSAAGD